MEDVADTNGCPPQFTRDHLEKEESLSSSQLPGSNVDSTSPDKEDSSSNDKEDPSSIDKGDILLPNDSVAEDEAPEPHRDRLNASSNGVAIQQVRPRSNASDYARNPTKTELSDESIASADEVKVVVEDNDSVIRESPTGGHFPADTKYFSPDEASGMVDMLGGQPEPGAVIVEHPRSSTLLLPLVSPGDSASASEDEGERGANSSNQELQEDEELHVAEEYPPEWYTEQKHVFIFSEAGKPIYSRYGKEETIVGLFGVMQALLSCVQDNRDDLQCIRTADRVFVFRCHPPLILVAVAGLNESEEQLGRQLKYVCNQAVFFLTLSHMHRLFKNRHNYDLRRQLTGLPKFFDGIIKFVEEEDSFLLGSIRCLPMPGALRNEITSILLSNRCPELVFAIIIYDHQIVSLVRPKQYAITSQDLHLLMNYVATGSTRGYGEKWAPCCLPDFNDGGYLYIHDSYISETKNISLVLITNEREQHLTMMECKKRIVDQMVDQKTLDKLHTVIGTPFVAADTKIPDLYHFVYKSMSSRQLVRPDFRAPYNSDDDRRQLHASLCSIYDKLHHSDQKLGLYFSTDERQSIVGCVQNNAEIYCAFSPFLSRPVALNNMDKLLRWIRREESRFFILGTGVY